MTKTTKSFSKKFKVHKRRVLKLKNHPLVIPVTTFVVMFFVAAVLLVALNGQTAGASDSRIVRLYVDGKAQILPTRAETVSDFLERTHTVLHEGDTVEPSLDTPILEDNFNINVYRAQLVTIIDNGKKSTVMSAEQDPRQIVQKAGYTVYPEDAVRAADPDEALKDGVIGPKLIIDRATPIMLNLYGTNIDLRTRAKTVADVLKEKNVQTLPDDVITPALTTPLSAGTSIFVTRVGKQIVTTEEVIPAPVQTLDDPSLTYGTSAVRQEGSAGKKVVTYEVELKNGKEVSRKSLQEIIATPPVTRIVARGTKVITLTGDKGTWLAASNIPPSQYSAADYVISHESGWRPGAINGSRCIGLGQSCGGALAGACPNWATDPVCQLNFFNDYAQRRYGGWGGAYNFWTVNHWW